MSGTSHCILPAHALLPGVNHSPRSARQGQPTTDEE